MMLRRAFLILILGLGLAACTPARDLSMPADTTFIVLRHADRTGEDLSDKGRARADALVEALQGTPIDAIYSPGIQRNLDTAAPLASARGLEVEPSAPLASARGLEVERFSAERAATNLVSLGAGRTVVWVGNKGNLNAIWDELSLPGPPPLEYGDLFFVTRDGTARTVVTRQRFGPDP